MPGPGGGDLDLGGMDFSVRSREDPFDFPLMVQNWSPARHHSVQKFGDMGGAGLGHDHGPGLDDDDLEDSDEDGEEP